MWSYNEDTNFNNELYFDENEIFDAFEKLCNKKRPLELEMKLFEYDNGIRFSVELKNKADGIFLEKFRFETETVQNSVSASFTHPAHHQAGL